FVIRTFKDEEIKSIAEAASIPVINALTDGHHPCQSIADLMTIAEHRGSLARQKIAYVGDGNNVAASLMQAAALAGTSMAIASPRGYQVPFMLVEEAREIAKKTGAVVTSTEDLREALADADVVYCDVWLSMGHSDAERAERNAALGPYQVNTQAMRLAKRDAIFM